MFGKGIIASLFLFTSCSHSNCNWCLEKPPLCNNAGRLYYPTKDNCYGMNFEIIRSGGEDWGYLSVLSFAFEEEAAAVAIELDEEKTLFLARRLEGHQKLLLSKEATSLIIQVLLDGKSINLNVGNFHTTLCPQDFARRYAQL